MRDKAVSSGTPVDVALAWNDHMARLLQHADTLLSEWETAARRSGETMAKTMRATVVEAAPAIVDELRRGLAESLRHDLQRMQRELAFGARPRGWLMPGLVAANLLLAIGFVFALARSPAPPAASLPREPPPPAKLEPPRAAPPAPVAAPTPAALPPAPTCEGLLPGEKPDARAVAAACAKVMCGRDEARCDAVLQVAARPRLRCKPKGDAAKGYAVDEPWLRECLKGK